MTVDRRAAHGRAGERIAAQYLENQGWQILARRYRGNRKEIDIIARDGSTVVFVEVKTDRTGNFGPPETWVNHRKQQAIIEAARYFLSREDERECDYRFDVVGVVLRPNQTPEIRHLRGAFTT